MKILFLFIFFLTSSMAVAQEPSYEENIKTILQEDLKNNYLTTLENIFGDCGANKDSCLEKKDDFIQANLPKGTICFPYTKCGFYHCMENKYHCSEVSNTYFTKLAYPTCSDYMDNIKKNYFSKKGIEWIYNVMVCLQKGLIDECEVRGKCGREVTVDTKKTCDHITDFTLKFHPGCYINSGVGVCHLPIEDKLNIWRTVGPHMTGREKIEAYKVIFNCILPIQTGTHK